MYFLGLEQEARLSKTLSAFPSKGKKPWALAELVQFQGISEMLGSESQCQGSNAPQALE